MKKCAKCKLDLPLDQFNKRSSSKDGLQPWCRDCNRETSKLYYKENKARVNVQTQERKQNRVAYNRVIVNEILVSGGCIDCGFNFHPAALDFDHISEKSSAVSVLVAEGYSLARVMEEIEKCEIRCANCHRLKTADDFNWYARKYDGKPIISRNRDLAGMVP